MSVEITVSELQQAADQCVKCAVCLPHCPTYALSPEETESPRGRITLLQGIVHDRLYPTPETFRHLNNCLSCGRCEQVCPAQVSYTRLLDGSRFLMQRHPDISPGPASLRQRIMAWTLASARTLRLIAVTARIANALGLRKLLGHSAPGRWLRWTHTDRRTTGNLTDSSDDPESVDALLFTGCLTDAFEQDIAVSARYVAARFGIALKPAPPGLCCGALYQHMGNAERCAELTRRNVAALSQDNKPIVGLLSGCARGLRDGLNFDSEPGAAKIAARMTDLFELIGSSNVVPAFIESSDAVGLYAPCSLGKQPIAQISKLLNRVATREPVVLGKAHGCCGAAGDHMFLEPERADELATPIVENILALGLTHVLVPNLGCAWHLRANLSKRGSAAIVEHPAQWLARHLK